MLGYGEEGGGGLEGGRGKGLEGEIGRESRGVGKELQGMVREEEVDQ